MDRQGSKNELIFSYAFLPKCPLLENGYARFEGTLNLCLLHRPRISTVLHATACWSQHPPSASILHPL